MKPLLVVIFFLISPPAFSNIVDQCPQFLAYQAPGYIPKANDQELCKQNYAVIHQCSTKTPVAVFEHITREKISGHNKRNNDFRADPDVMPSCRAVLKDYAGNNYDRGHLSAAANNTTSKEIMSESFFLSNIIPHVPNNNRGIWKQLETWVRHWVQEHGELYVISGAIYDSGFDVIGNGVGIPTRLYKIVIDKKKGTSRAWIIPNVPVSVIDLPKYQTSVAAVEKATGINFNIK